MSRVGAKTLSGVKIATSKAAMQAAVKSADGLKAVTTEKLAQSYFRTITRGKEICFRLEPVDMATGNMVDFKTDVFIDGILPLRVDRNANTNYELGRALGPRWVSTMDVRIEVCDNEVLMLAPDGALITFPPAPKDGSEVRADGRPWLLSYADGAYRVRDIAAGLTYTFRLFDTTPTPNTTAVGVKDCSPSLGGTYVAATVPAGSVADVFNMGIEIGVSSLTHHTGATIDYTWDLATGHMVQMRRSDDTIITLHWDNTVGKVAHVDVSNPTTHPHDKPLRLISYEYDAYGQLVRVINSNDGALKYHYDHAGRIYAWTDRNDVSYYYRFDHQGRVQSQVGTGGMFPNIVYWGPDEGTDAPPGGTVCVALETAGEFQGDPLTLGDSVIEQYFQRLEQLPLYQALIQGGLKTAGLTGRGRIAPRDDNDWTVPQDWLYDDLLGHIRPTVYRSTPAGDVWRIITPEGRTEDTTYNNHHQKTSITNPAGATTRFSYNANGTKTTTVYPDGSRFSIEPASWDAPARIIDAYGQVTECVTDEFGMVESFTTSSGATTTYTYDVRPSGIVQTSIAHPDGTSTQIERDDAGRILASTDPARRRSSFVRDVRGLITQSMDPSGATTTVDYSPEGWPTGITYPDGTSASVTYDGEGNHLCYKNEIGATQTTEYTVFDTPAATTDASGATTKLAYNTQMEPLRLTNADNNAWTYSYDLDGRLVKQVDYNGFATTTALSNDGLAMTLTTPVGSTTRTLHADGRLASIVDGLGETSYFYDDVGRLIEVTGPQASISYDWDEFGRATTETVRLVSGETTVHHLDIDHSGTGRSEAITLPLGDRFTTHFEHNEAGEISHTVHTYSAPHSDVPSELARLSYGTDQRGYRNKITAGSLIRTTTSDIKGRVSSDTLNVLDSAADGGMRTVSSRMFDWRADSALQSVTDYLRGVTTYELDVLGRATGVSQQNPDPNMRIDLHKSHPCGLATSESLPAVQTEKYSFTAGGVLNGVSTIDPTASLSGGAGDKSARADDAVEFSGTLPTRVGRTSYKYDDAGRVVQTVTKRRSKRPLVHNFFYATSEQPIGFTTSDEPGIGYRYLYDPHGRRVAKEQVNAETGEVLTRTVYAHSGNQLVGEQVTYAVGDHSESHHGHAYTPASFRHKGVPAACRQAVGDGHIWTMDPATEELIGQITLVPSFNAETHAEAPGLSGPVAVQPRFDLIMADLAGAPREIVDIETGVIKGEASQTLYGKRTWRGKTQSPLLHAGQYLDTESGWAYNRYRYYHPHAGIYNAQDPLGVTPRIASAQGYVDHPAHWIDYLGLSGKGGHEKLEQLAKNMKQGAKGEKTVREIINGFPGVSSDYQMTVKANGVTSRIDAIVKRGDNYEFIEVKTGNAQLTKNQTMVRDVLNGTSDGSKPGAVELRASDEKARKIGKEQGHRIKGRFHQLYADNADDRETLVGILDGTA